MSMGKRRMNNHEEYDAYTSWRHVLCYIQRAGVRKSIKRSTHKRERREDARQTIEEFLDADFIIPSTGSGLHWPDKREAS